MVAGSPEGPVLLLLLSLLAPARATPPGFTAKGEASGCQLFLGPTESDGVVAMRAECRWEDVDAALLDEILSSPWDHAAVWEQVVEARILSQSQDEVRLWVQHLLIAMPDREVVIDWRRSEEEGVLLNRWTTAPVDWELAPGNARCNRYEGFWELRVEEDVVLLVHEDHYDPGPFPAWMIRPFLSHSLARMVADLHDYVRLP